MLICYTKVVRSPKASECQFNCMCTAIRPISTYALIPELKRKHIINHRNSIHFRKLWWCQLEEKNSLRKSLMSYHNCFSFCFSYLALSTLFSVCLLSHCHSFILRHSFATDTTHWYEVFLELWQKLSWNRPHICFIAHSMQNLIFFQNVLHTTQTNFNLLAP